MKSQHNHDKLDEDYEKDIHSIYTVSKWKDGVSIYCDGKVGLQVKQVLGEI